MFFFGQYMKPQTPISTSAGIATMVRCAGVHLFVDPYEEEWVSGPELNRPDLLDLIQVAAFEAARRDERRGSGGIDPSGGLSENARGRP